MRACTDPHRKVGWMVRESQTEDAAHISAVAHGDGLTVLQWRVKKGMAMRDPEDEIFSPEKNVQTIQVERKGDDYTIRVAKKGAALQTVGSHRIPTLTAPLLWACIAVRIIRKKWKLLSSGTFNSFRLTLN